MSTSTKATSSTITPKAIGAIVLGVLALLFVFQNTNSGRVNVYFWKIDLPAWIWMLLLFGAGVAVGLLIPTLRRRRT